MTDHNITVTPITGTLGATIGGVNLAEKLDDAIFAEVRDAFLKYHVIFFPNQTVEPEQQKAFGERFGTFNIHPYVGGMEGHPEVMEIIKEPHETLNFGGGWHSDMSFQEEPALGSILYAVEVPEAGGDTLFANQHAAYDALSPGMKAMIEQLKAIHSAGKEYGPKGVSSRPRKSMDLREVVTDETPEFAHPVVRTHPETGEKALYVNSAFTQRFEGMTRRESRPLLKFLWEHATREEFTCRHRWRKGDVAFWDNRSLQHYALNDYNGQRRHMRRVTINGGRPF